MRVTFAARRARANLAVLESEAPSRLRTVHDACDLMQVLARDYAGLKSASHCRPDRSGAASAFHECLSNADEICS